MTPQVREHLWQLALERGAGQPVRHVSGRVDGGAITQQRAGASGGGLEFPKTRVRLEVAVDLPERDALVLDELGTERPVQARRVPAEIDLVFDELPAVVRRSGAPA